MTWLNDRSINKVWNMNSQLIQREDRGGEMRQSSTLKKRIIKLLMNWHGLSAHFALKKYRESPSIFYHSTCWGSQGGLEPTPASSGKVVVHPGQVVSSPQSSHIEINNHPHSHSHLQASYSDQLTNYPQSACFWTVGGRLSALRDPTQTQGEHANSPQNGPDPGNRTKDLIANRINGRKWMDG